ncbi:MAG: tetratricopeptide repeat protein [Ignavibacteriaceae bacterium]
MKKTVVLLLTFLFACSTENWDSLRIKTETAFNNKNYSEALEYLDKAASQEPQNAEVQYYLGQAYRLMLFSDGGMLNKVNIPYAEKSSEHFRKCIEISPKYTGKKFVIDPYSKIQTIWGSVAMTYLFNSKPDSAKWAFNRGQAEGGFYPAILEYNKNIMASCEKNAVLFTNGDNDTYPMWFLQFMENYRTDITLVNVSLFNVSWYIKQLKNGYPFGENNLFMMLTDADIDSLRPVHWKEKTVEIPVKHDPLNKKGKIEWLVKPTIEDRAIRVQDLMLMEILKSNEWNRTVYFSTTVYSANKLGLDKYLSLEGLVYKLNSHEGKTSIEKLNSNLTNVYTYDGVNDEHIGYIDEIANLYQNYREAFITLASLYDEAGQKVKVKEVLNIMDEKLPETQLPYSSEEMLKKSDSLYDKNL